MAQGRIGVVADRAQQSDLGSRVVSLAGTFLEKVRKDNLRFLTEAVAWAMLVSVVPIAIGMLAVTGMLFQHSSQQAVIAKFISGAFRGVLKPHYLNHLVTVTLGHSAIAGIIAIVGVMWAADQVGFGISCAFEAIFEVRARRFVAERLIHIGMFLVFVALLFLIVGATVMKSVVTRDLGSSTGVWLIGFPITTLVSLSAAFVLFAVVYMVYPNTDTRLRFRHVWKGALAAAVLFQILTFVWPLYVESLSKYGGILVPLLILILWIYFFATIMLLGAEVVAIAAIRDGNRRGESIGAPPDGSAPGHSVLRETVPNRVTESSASTPT
jgi:membrane protein